MFNILDLLFPKYCLGCDTEGQYLCLSCKTKPFKLWSGSLELLGEKYFDELYCLGDYEDELLGQLIKTCKYRFVKELNNDLGILLVNAMSDKKCSGVVVAVPLSKRRERWRGFNQSEEIAKIFAREFKFEYRNCLIRIKYKKAQAKLSELERQQNMAGCFEVRGEIPDNIILIDDVVTTGTTINECARILKQGGAKKITVCALAKG